MLYLGMFYKDGKRVKVWVFYMILAKSRYAFYRTLTKPCLSYFLESHISAFSFFKGVPKGITYDPELPGTLKTIHDESRALKLHPALLKHYQIRKHSLTNAIRSKVLLKEHKVLRHQIWHDPLHRSYNRLLKDLENFMHCTNHFIPAWTSLSRYRDYKQFERPMMNPMPLVPYPIVPCTHRKVNASGYVLYHCNYYSVPQEWAKSLVKIQVIDRSVYIVSSGVVIASHERRPLRGRYIVKAIHKAPYHGQGKMQYMIREEVKKIGPTACKLLEAIKKARPSHWHRMARQLLALQYQFSHQEIEKGCELALRRKKYNYRAVKAICHKNTQNPRH